MTSRRKGAMNIVTCACFGTGRELTVGHINRQKPAKSSPETGEVVTKTGGSQIELSPTGEGSW